MGMQPEFAPQEPRAEARLRFARLVNPDRGAPPLVETALVIALEEYPELGVRRYLARLHAYASVLHDKIGLERRRGPVEEIDVESRLRILNRYLFEELKFRGNRDTYYDPRNSFLNQVIDRRLGIPITLSLLYLELGRAVGLRLVGVAFPGHFLVRTAGDGHVRYLDPYNLGAEVSLAQLEEQLRKSGHDEAGRLEILRGVDNRTILRRLLLNLKLVYLKREEYRRALQVVDKLILLHPDAVEERRDQGILYGHVGRYRQATQALEKYLELAPTAEDRALVEEQLERFRYWRSRVN